MSTVHASLISAPTDPTAPDPTAPDPTQGALAELRAEVAGRVVTPRDADWDLARMPWSLAVAQTPLAVVEVANAEDVRRAVGWALRHGHQVTAQPVGHGATTALGQSMENVLLLRTRALDTITVDAGERTATIGAGVKAGELLVALDGTGLTYLAGSSPDPTVVGMSISGGLSWFGRAYGLAANSIVAAELVDGWGEIRRVSETEEPELFWAVRGGGGDFGIITSLEIGLHPGSELYGGRLLWPVDQLAEVMGAFRAVTETAPEELSVWFHAYQFPPLPEVPEPVRGQSFAAVAVAFLGSAADAERLLAPLRAVPGVVMDLLGPVPMTELGRIADEPTEPTPTMEHSLFLSDLGEETIQTIGEITGAGSGSPLAVVQIRHLGGAFARRDPGEGAAGHLDQPYILFALGIPAMPELAAAIQTTFDRLDQALSGHSNGRTVPNFLGADGDPRRAWAPEVLQRLTAIKRDVDPQSVIRSNRSISGESA